MGLEGAPPKQDKTADTAPINRLLQDSSLYLLGNVLARVVGFIAIPFYSRYLSPAQYGLIELVELSTQTIAITFGLQAIGAALSRLFYDQQSPDAERAVVSTALIGTAILSAIVTLAAVGAAGRLSLLMFHSDEWTSLLRAAFIAMFFSNMIEVVLVYERIRDNARFFLMYSMVTLVLSLSLNILFIGFLGAGVWGFVTSKLIVAIGSCVYLAFRMRRDVGWHWRWPYVPQLVRFGAPLIVSSLSYFTIHFSDRLFLSSSVSLAELGRYALAYRFAILVSALVGDSFAKSWGVTLYRYVGRPRWQEQFARVASYFTYILFVTGLALALFSPELLRVMVPETFFPPPVLLPIIIASYLAREIGDFFRSLLLINKRSVLVGQIAGGGALLNIAANLLLIPHYGIYGAAVATFVTWLAYMIVCWVVANREHKLPISTAAYLRITLLLVAVFAAAATTRTDAFVLQFLIDGAWLTAFAVLAFAWFFTKTERRGAVDMAVSLCVSAVARGGPPARPVEGGPLHVLSIAYEVPRAVPGIVSTIVCAIGPGPERQGAPAIVLVADPSVSSAEPPQQGWLIRIASGVMHQVDRFVAPSGSHCAWLPHAFAAAAWKIDSGTVVYSTGQSVVAGLVALALQQRYGVPWVADLRMQAPGTASAGFIGRALARFASDKADAIIVDSVDAAAWLASIRLGPPSPAQIVTDDADLDRIIDKVRIAHPS